MDTRIFASNLTAINKSRDQGRRSSPEALENAHYEKLTPTPADDRVLRIASVMAAVCFGFMTIGLWLQ